MDDAVLNGQEIDTVREEIMKSGLTRFRLNDLRSRFWRDVDFKTEYGRKFKMTVQSGRLQGILSYGKTVENHQVYQIECASAQITGHR